MQNEKSDDLPTRPSLLRRLRNWEDDASWNDFVRTYSHFIRGIAFKAGLSSAEAEDVSQETLVAVAKQMPEFKYDPAVGSFKNWLAVIARRRIADAIRKKHFQAGSQRLVREERLATVVMDKLTDADKSLDVSWNEEWSRSVIEVASANVKQRLPVIEFQMFHLHVVKEIPVPDVSKRLGVKQPQVYSAKYKVGAMMKREIKRLERQLL